MTLHQSLGKIHFPQVFLTRGTIMDSKEKKANILGREKKEFTCFNRVGNEKEDCCM